MKNIRRIEEVGIVWVKDVKKEKRVVLLMQNKERNGRKNNV
jgi:hypothetical protein